MALILVAEDDPAINSLMTLTLRMEGYDVVQARDGEEALEQAAQHQPDLVLLDVMLPRLNGYQVAQTLKQHPGASPTIIFVTAKHEVEDLISGLELAVDYVVKPFVVPELLARVRAALRVRTLQQELLASNQQLERLAHTDGLTGLHNRRGFDVSLEEELWRTQRYGQPVAVLMFDLDRFKLVNDTWGHPQGDVVLQHFAQVLLHSSRRIDKVARFGGEEFAALLPATDISGAHTFAEKVRTAIAEAEIPCTTLDGASASSIRVTVSGGGAVAQNPDQADLTPSQLAQNMLHCADRCLYQAKNNGRNRVVIEPFEMPAKTTPPAPPLNASNGHHETYRKPLA